LTEVLEKISTLNLEFAKIPENGQSPSGLTAGMRGHIADQRRLLVRQAAYLATLIPELVNPFEYLVVAGCFADIDAVDEAEIFFRKAIVQVESEPLNLGIITRGFGRFLFRLGELNQGREQYEAAVAVFSGDSDTMRFYRGDTYMRWASQELDWSFVGNASQLFERARAEFTSQQNPNSKNRNLQRLDKVLESASVPIPQISGDCG
jgi:hypothetical protein